MENQYVLHELFERLGTNFEKLLHVLNLEALLYQLFELVLSTLELFMKIRPWQGAIIYQVHHYKNYRLDVVPPRLVVATTAIQTREFKITRELFKVLFEYVRAIFILILDGETKIDQVHNLWVNQTDQNIFGLDIIMNISEFVNLSYSLNLKGQNILIKHFFNALTS